MLFRNPMSARLAFVLIKTKALYKLMSFIIPLFVTIQYLKSLSMFLNKIKFLIFFTIVLISNLKLSAMNQIIYLNGPSSSGKTTLAKALQESLQEPFLHVGIDKMISYMPSKLNNWVGGEAPDGFFFKKDTGPEGHPIQVIHSGSFAKRITRSLKDITRLLASQGYNLIIDDVAIGGEEILEWKETLNEYRVLYVGVVTPLEILEKREKARGDRMLGSARGQYYLVHENAEYDLEVDTFSETLENNVKRIKKALEEK